MIFFIQLSKISRDTQTNKLITEKITHKITFRIIYFESDLYNTTTMWAIRYHRDFLLHKNYYIIWYIKYPYIQLMKQPLRNGQHFQTVKADAPKLAQKSNSQWLWSLIKIIFVRELIWREFFLLILDHCSALLLLFTIWSHDKWNKQQSHHFCEWFYSPCMQYLMQHWWKENPRRVVCYARLHIYIDMSMHIFIGFFIQN